MRRASVAWTITAIVLVAGVISWQLSFAAKRVAQEKLDRASSRTETLAERVDELEAQNESLEAAAVASRARLDALQSRLSREECAKAARKRYEDQRRALAESLRQVESGVGLDSGSLLELLRQIEETYRSELAFCSGG